MSLFGGDDLSAANSSSQAFPAAQQDSLSGNGHSAPVPASHNTGLDLNDNDASNAPVTTEDERQSEEQAEEDNGDFDYMSSGTSQSEERPNKFQGKAWEWRSWTAPERQLAASLDQLQAEDLSLHLYNAHGLKRRLRKRSGEHVPKSWRSKESWISNEAEWRPSKPWTAWPVRPDIVPRETEGFNRKANDEFDAYTIKRAGTWKPSFWLEEELMATTLRIAKDGFDNRELEEEWIESEEGTAQNGDIPDIKDAAYMTDDSQAGMSDYPRKLRVRRKVRREDPGPPLRPVVMADDDQAKRILQPTTRHILSSLDNLLAGLRHSRQAYALSSTEGDTSDAQTELEPEPARAERSEKDETANQTKRRAGRPRKPRPLVPTDIPPVPAQEEDDELSDSSPASAGKKRKVGRPRKYPKPLEGETYYMMRQRLAEESKLSARARRAAHRANVSTSEPESPTASQSTQRKPNDKMRSHSKNRSKSTGYSSSGSTSDLSARSVTKRSGSSTDEKASRQSRTFESLGLRDWSEVIGIASIVGWDPKVVARTASRCAKLFGESLEMRTLGDKGAPVTTESITEFTPFGVRSDSINAPSVSSRNNPASRENSTSLAAESRLNEAASASISSLSQPCLEGSLTRPRPRLPQAVPYSPWSLDPQRTCPIPECRYHNHVFKKRWNLHNHIRRTHGEEFLSSADTTHRPTPTPASSCRVPGTPVPSTIPTPPVGLAVNGVDRNSMPASIHTSPSRGGGSKNLDIDLIPHALLHPYDETLGGVHVDGFLKPIPPPPPIRGQDRTKRKARTDYMQAKRKRSSPSVSKESQRSRLKEDEKDAEIAMQDRLDAYSASKAEKDKQQQQGLRDHTTNQDTDTDTEMDDVSDA
ncbi:hypothetical protein L228DRAFT_8310 [Xylona heveae TC161]|uniref:Rrn9 domain-containing protein n=1 Tax=Xylona heveae (strain CBS 132557 / TC161) TaxID=1328760 RepID=A0A165JHF5_XYLHT|nr:hypothetical protein L228DRAFT_8310 [Xylona heveae TC161]KZF26246.1 hypothetical protein L228DRAFT_8310 [Xylona heveae TC161]